MLCERIRFVVNGVADDTVHLGIAEPSGLAISNTLIFDTRADFASALEAAGLPAGLAHSYGPSAPHHVTYSQLVLLGFF